MWMNLSAPIPLPTAKLLSMALWAKSCNITVCLFQRARKEIWASDHGMQYSSTTLQTQTYTHHMNICSMYLCWYLYIYVCTCVCMYVGMCICMHECIYICMSLVIHIVCKHVYAHIYTHVERTVLAYIPAPNVIFMRIQINEPVSAAGASSQDVIELVSINDPAICIAWRSNPKDSIDIWITSSGYSNASLTQARRVGSENRCCCWHLSFSLCTSTRTLQYCACTCVCMCMCVCVCVCVWQLRVYLCAHTDMRWQLKWKVSAVRLPHWKTKDKSIQICIHLIHTHTYAQRTCCCKSASKQYALSIGTN